MEVCLMGNLSNLKISVDPVLVFFIFFFYINKQYWYVMIIEKKNELQTLIQEEI